MKSFKEYFGHLILEELHPEIQSILDSNRPAEHKLKMVTQKARQLLASGQETGLMDGRPKKGSSRAVFFPKEGHSIMLDGKPAVVPSVVKIAFPGYLDKYNKSGKLLGEHQNETEADSYTNRQYGILRPSEEGGYETNHFSGILPPLLGSHPDHHYLHVGRMRPFKTGEFREMTKTPEFPNGISHKDFYNTLMYHFNTAHGRGYYNTPKNIDELENHPLIEKVQNFVADTGQHPGDLRMANLGVYEHPDGKQKFAGISDFGFSKNVADEYQKARINKYKYGR